jgi:aminoglycoside phosphotransferase (APT) family kinase protein
MNRPDTDTDQVHRLIAAQFPQWKDLSIRPVDHGGWDNRTFHLGEAMTVRLPSGPGYVPQVEKEQRWLPVLAPQLPLPIPVPLAMGVPGEGFPFPWSVYGWIDGEQTTVDKVSSLTEYAADLAGFLTALARADATGGPAAGTHNSWRGGPLPVYDGETRKAIADLGDRIDGGLATKIWNEALSSEWDRPSVWVHGDVAYGNLLVRDRKLAAVIDFGSCGVGDPACDLAIAWTFLEGESRARFREALDVDARTWARGRGWTLWKALITYDQIPARGRSARQVLEEIFAEFG